MEDIMVARQRYTVRTVYTCNDCDMETLNEAEMLMHVRQQIKSECHLNEAVACQQLGEDSISPGTSQQSHTLVDQTTADELVMKDVLTCIICEKRFQYKSCFEYHARRHHTGTVLVTGQTLPTVSDKESQSVAEKTNLLKAVVEPPISNAEPYSVQPKFEKSCPLIESGMLSSCSKEPPLHNTIVIADDTAKLVQDKLCDDGDSNSDDTPATTSVVEKTGHICNKCDKHFSTERGLNIHMSKHKKDGKKEFQNTKDELAHHCMICSQQFNTAEEIVSHVKSVHCDVTAIPCEHCGDSFASPEAYDEHVKANPTYLCNSCGFRLSDVKSTGTCCICNMEQVLVNGTKGYSDEIQQTAATADETPATTETGCRSVIIFGQATPPEQQSPFVCSVCGRKFAWRSNLRRHMRMHAPKLAADCANKTSKCHDGECHACGRAFDNLDNTFQRDHFPDESSNPSNAKAKRFSCTICGQQFVWSHNLRRHMRRTHADPFYIAAAEEAKKTYSTYSNAKLNGDVVDDKTVVNVDSMEPTDGGKCVCKTCGHHFFWESNLRRHIQQVHHSKPDDEIGSKTGNHTCAKCGRRFKQMYHLRVHLRAHFKADRGAGSAKPHLCSTCGRNFADARQLRVHQLRHSGIKPHQCSKCGKAFTVLTLLNEHVATKHEGRRLVCEQCGHEANSRSALHTHIRYVHAAPGTVRPYVCSTCSRGFWSSAALKRHESVHTEAGNSKRKAMCSICQMLFRHIYNLEHHIKSSHQMYAHSTPFACSTCREQFSSGAAFKTHYRSKHRNR